MSSTNSDSFFFFFFSNLDSFYSFSSLIAVARPFEIKLNNSGENEHPCFVPDLRGNVFSISLLSMMLAVSLLYTALIVLRYIPSMSTFWRIFFFFIINGCWILSKAFVKIYWDDHMVFILPFVHVLYHTGLQILKNLCISGINSTWLWCTIFLVYYQPSC